MPLETIGFGWRSHLAALHWLGLLYRRPGLNLFLLLLPPLLWFGTVYLGSLIALLMQSFYAIDEFTASISRHAYTLTR